jgi:hypothetical protein
VFRSLGRSIAFASGGFLAFARPASSSASRSTPRRKRRSFRSSSQAQFRASGKSFPTTSDQIDHTVNRLSLLAGFKNDEVKSAFLTIFRTTGCQQGVAGHGDCGRSREGEAHRLAQAALIVAKTEAGNTTLLRRQGFQIAKNAKVRRRWRRRCGRSRRPGAAGTTEQERFGAVLHDTEEIVGTGILPVLNKYLARGLVADADERVGKLQKNVAAAADGFASAISAAAGVVKTADRVTGSFKNTLELLLALKLASFATNAAAGIGLIGSASQTSAERVALLRGSLTKLGAIGAVTVVVEVVIHRKQVDDFAEKIRRRSRATTEFPWGSASSEG